MRTPSIQMIPIFVLLSSLVACPFAMAGNPLEINIQGKPLTWHPTKPIKYKIDSDHLGMLNFDQAHTILKQAMQLWEQVEGTSIQFEYAGAESAEINGENWSEFSSPYLTASKEMPSPVTPSQDQGYLLIVFDNDAQILSHFSGSHVPGSTAITGYWGFLEKPDFIKSATLFLNGQFLDGDPSTTADINLQDLLGIVVHELGHVLGLSHSVFNHTLYNDIVYGNLNPNAARYLPTMFPAFIRGYGNHNINLHPDDIATIRWMYGDENILLAKGSVANQAKAPLYSMLVTARNIDSPLCEAYSQATSMMCDYQNHLFRVEGADTLAYGRTCDTPSKLGIFEIPILSEGNYVFDVGEINTLLGTSVIARFGLGAYPQAIPGGAEFYERHDSANEDALDYDIIDLRDSSEGLDFILSSTTVTTDRTRRLHHSLFETDAFGKTHDHDPHCPLNFEMDVAQTVGVNEKYNSIPADVLNHGERPLENNGGTGVSITPLPDNSEQPTTDDSTSEPSPKNPEESRDNSLGEENANDTEDTHREESAGFSSGCSLRVH